MRKVAIYVLCDPVTRAVRYCGRSSNPDVRLQQHIWEARQLDRQYYKCRWIRSLNTDPVLEVLEWVDEADAVAAEGAWIRELTRMGAALTNTGTETQGAWTVAAWEASAASTRGKPRSITPEGLASQKEKRAKQVIGPRSDETKAKISARMSGQKKSAAHAAAIGLGHSGERHWNTKLTADQVRALRAEVESGASRKEVAEKYGLKPNTLACIVLRRSWKHV